ncbi:MAG: hypothetical protein QXE10_07700 [Desulfurococcaceae archaeon]
MEIELGCTIKLIAEVLKSGDSTRASVKSKKIPVTHQLADVMGVTNILTFETDHLGLVTSEVLQRDRYL